MTPGGWIRKSYINYLRVRTLYLLPDDKEIEPIYSGTFVDSDHCPKNKEERYLFRSMDQGFRDRAEMREHADSDDSDREDDIQEAMEVQPLVALGANEQADLVDQIQCASPPRRSTDRGGLHQELPVRKTRKIPTGAETTLPPPGPPGKRKRSFMRRISDLVRSGRDNSPADEETSPTAAVKERRDRRQASQSNRLTKVRDQLKSLGRKTRGGGNEPPEA
jgi:hypothetical protein